MTLPTIPEGWVARGDLPQIELDRLNDIDPGVLDEDLLQVTDPSGRLTLDTGWYPAGDSSGQFICQAIYGDNWEEPLDELQTRDVSQVTAWFEDWMLRSKEILGEDGEIFEGSSVLVPISVYVVFTEPPALVEEGTIVPPRQRPSNVASQYMWRNPRSEESYAA